MAKRLQTEEMTEPPSDDTPSKRMSSVANVDFDDILKNIAKAVYRNSDISDLGKALGFGPADIDRKIEENDKQGGNYMGTLDLLRMWRKRQTPSTEKAALRSALFKAGFDNLADQYLSTPVTAESAEVTVQQTEDRSKNKGDDEAMPSEIMKLREQLKRRYCKKFGQIKTSPVDSESRTSLQHVYVSLALMLGLEGEKEEPIDYDGLFKFIKTDTLKGFVTRLAFIGEAGVGKSTLFAKIALDWAEGTILQEICLLFLESFREIKESGFFGDTVMGHFPDDSEIKGELVDAYVRENQRKTLILLDGLDEAHINIKQPNCNNAIVSIVRGEQFIDTPVVITTRPFRADEIKSIMTINDHYTFVKVKGFTKENKSTYIKNYFKDDSQSASTLINFIDTNQVVSEYMAPYPIFCSLLCCLWKTPSGRENIQTMETFSQLLKRLVFSLQEQYSSKRNELEEGYGSRMNKVDESMKELGCIAFQGLLVKQLIFDEKALDSCIEAARTACEVGILSMEKRPAPLQIRESQPKQFIQEFSFPHKLLQEYVASFYLASLFHKDCREFNRILADTLLEDYKEFRYVLYFTAAHGGEVGKSVLETLCKKVDDMEFIIQVAFECHDSEAIDPVRNLLKTKTNLMLAHPIAALVFTLESIGKEVVRRSSSIRETLGVRKSFEANASSSHVAAVGLFTLQNLRGLTFESVRLDDEFYTGMSAAASQSKIEMLLHMSGDLGSAASYHFARGLCSMPCLRSLGLNSVKLSDEFYSTMASEASKSKLQTVLLWNVQCPTSAPSHHLVDALCSMPNLTELKLIGNHFQEEFYSTLNAKASTLQVQILELGVVQCPRPASSHHLAEALCSMPHLTDLTRKMDLNEEFYYSTLKAKASSMQVPSLKLHDVRYPTQASSHHLAEALCSMPNLTDLFLEMDLNEEFYSTLKAKASSIQGSFPQIRKGNFRFNEVALDDLNSFLHIPACFQSLPVHDSDGSNDSENSADLSSSNDSVIDVLPRRTLPPSDHPQQQLAGDVRYPRRTEIPEKQSNQESRWLHLDTTDDGNQIHWDFLTDCPQELTLQDDEAVISCGIRFSPSGAKLSEPIKVTLDHNAHFSNPSGAEIVFYTRNKDSKSFVRIPASTGGYPRCDVRAKDLDLYVDHFSDWWIVGKNNANFFGKTVICTPYVQPPVRKEFTQLVLLCIHEDLKDVNQKIKEEMTPYTKLFPSQPMIVEWKHGDINIKLFDGPKGNEMEIEEQRLCIKDIKLLDRKQLSFDVKPLESGVRQKFLKFTLNQTKSPSDPTLIRFELLYDDMGTTRATAEAQAAGVSTLSQIDLESEVHHPSTSSDKHHVDNTSDTYFSQTNREGSGSRSGSHKRKNSIVPQDDPEIPEKQSKTDLESDGILNTLSKLMPPGTYATLCTHLGIGYDEANSILDKFTNDYRRATRHCLAQWKTRTGGNMAKLKTILHDVEAGDLVKYLA